MNVKGIKHKPQGTAEKGNEIVAKWVFFFGKRRRAVHHYIKKEKWVGESIQPRHHLKRLQSINIFIIRARKRTC